CHMGDTCGELTPMEALGRSCNVCFVQIAQQIGPKAFSKYQEIFNIGQKTGIDLPGEADTRGLIYYEDGLGEIELATCSFGQGYNVSMVQFAAAYSSIINGGYYYQPHVVTGIVDSDGNVVKKIEPVLVRRTISEDTAEYMKEALRYVTTHGTASVIAPKEGYAMGGKTGAAEKLPRGTGKYVVSFISAAPIENPKVLLYVTIDEPDVEDQSSSTPAQQLAHDCWDGLYSYFGVYPETEDDAYLYDWSGLRDSTGQSELAGGQSFIDDPEHTIIWLTIEQPPETQVLPAEEPEYRPEEESTPTG
ncbi:MAG: penicillin-binding protein 2, partial [Lachnospiraceae bacterium]|nr:penicillin-binding protein 2 [Lachnospiraceae bacterium]